MAIARQISIEDLTLSVTEEIHVRASIEKTLPVIAGTTRTAE